MTKLSDQFVNLRNISQTARNSMPLFANKILESAGINKREQKFRDFKLTEDMVVGGRTPNAVDAVTDLPTQGLEITEYSQVAGAIDSLVPDQIKNFVGAKEWKSLYNKAKAEYVYMVNKDNPAKLEAIFTTDEITAFQKAEQLSKDLPGQLAGYLVEVGFLKDKDLADDYVRFVQSQHGRDLLNKPVTLDV